MATILTEELKGNESKTEKLASINNDKLENITKIRQKLENLINELDDHDKILSKGFNDIQSLIDDQRKKFDNLSNQFEKTQKIPNIINNNNEDETKYKDKQEEEEEYVLFPSIPSINNIKLPPKIEPIKILPFKPIGIDFDFLNKKIEEKSENNNNSLKPEDDQQFDDIKQTDSEKSEFDNIDDNENDIQIESKDEKIYNLMKMDLPKDVFDILGERNKWNIPKKKKLKSKMERDLRKITTSIDDLDEHQRKYAKLSVLKYYDILSEIFANYCKIGGDNDWLTQKGWIALYKDAFICDKKSDGCKDDDISELFNEIYDSHHNKNNHNNNNDEWSGIWKQDSLDSGGACEEYIIKQIGDIKLLGFIKSFSFCNINGSINSFSRNTSQFIIFWHQSARKGKRRQCKCTLTDPKTMSVEWKSIGSACTEEGIYTMRKYDNLSEKEDHLFKYKIGLSRHEYFDAILFLAKLKYPQFNDKRYESLCKLCEEYLIPYTVWKTMENSLSETIKAIFRPHSTELHKLFAKYGLESSENSLLGLDVWQVLCLDILKQDKSAFNKGKGGKPTNNDIIVSFELAKQGYDLQLTYKAFENALQNLAHKMYKKKPKQKYVVMPFTDKLKKLLKWAVKLQKSGYQPIHH